MSVAGPRSHVNSKDLQGSVAVQTATPSTSQMPDSATPTSASSPSLSLSSRASSTTPSTSSSAQTTPKLRTRIVIRLIPPEVTQQAFEKLVASWVNPQTTDSWYYVPGHISKRGMKAPTPARAYVEFKTKQDLGKFVKEYSPFIPNDLSPQTKIEYAPYQMKFKPTVTADRTNTIESDAHFKAFVARLNNPEAPDVKLLEPEQPRMPKTRKDQQGKKKEEEGTSSGKKRNRKRKKKSDKVEGIGAGPSASGETSTSAGKAPNNQRSTASPSSSPAPDGASAKPKSRQRRKADKKVSGGPTGSSGQTGGSATGASANTPSIPAVNSLPDIPGMRQINALPSSGSTQRSKAKGPRPQQQNGSSQQPTSGSQPGGGEGQKRRSRPKKKSAATQATSSSNPPASAPTQPK